MKNRWRKITSIISLLYFVSIALSVINIPCAASISDLERLELYNKNNVIGHFVHKGPIKGTIYDGAIDVRGTEVDDKWRMEQVTLYEQSDFASPGPNKHRYKRFRPAQANILLTISPGRATLTSRNYLFFRKTPFRGHFPATRQEFATHQGVSHDTLLNVQHPCISKRCS